MGDMGETFHALRQERVQRNAARLAEFEKELPELKKQFSVRFITPHHYRFNDTLDLFPSSRRFHNIKKQTRGSYTNASAILHQHLKL